MTDRIVVDDALQRYKLAAAELDRICRSTERVQRFRMALPANPERDSDLLIGASLEDVPALIARIEELEGELP